MPKNAVYVGRGSKWGNPFTVGKDGARLQCVELYNLVCSGYLVLTEGDHDQQRKVQLAIKNDLGELKGKDLACWCRDDGKPCHADILLRLANK